MYTVNIAILTPFIVALFIPFLYKRLSAIHTGWFVLAVPVALFAILASYIPAVANGETFYSSIPWLPSLGINFTAYLDGLGLIFALLITGVGSLVILYSIYYLSKERESLHHFYIYLLMFMGAMLGVVFSDNLLVLYVFWELTSISSFLLIAYWHHRRQSRYGAQKSMLITVMGGIGMLAGFLMLSSFAGTFSVREIIGGMGDYASHALFVPAMLLILLGAFTKSAQFPFHIWLPDAMEAPTPVSAYLHSATMVKAGIYLVARFTPVFGGEAVWFWVVSIVGIVTLFWGSFTAIRQTDLKALLAYSTISQLGLIMTLLGLGSAALHFDVIDNQSFYYSLAIFAALFHLVNHSTFKGALFMVVGIVDHETGTRDIRKLGGLMTVMPVTFTVAVIGSFSMAGLPPFNGFLSKEMFFTAVLRIIELPFFSVETWGLLFPIIAWLASVLTFVYCLILIFKTFFGEHQPEKLEKSAHEAPFGMLVSPVILASLVVAFFFFPNVLGEFLLKPAYGAVMPAFIDAGVFDYQIKAWHGINTELLMTLGIVGLGLVLYRSLPRWVGVYSLFPAMLSLDRLYNGALISVERRSNEITNRYMTGNMYHYLLYIFLVILGLVYTVALTTGALSFNVSNDAPISIYEGILAAVMAITAISILFAKSRMTGILLNGVLGYLVALFFVFFRAPDLALTQLVIETVTAALFLLCFYFLPDWDKQKHKTKPKLLNGLIAVATGAMVTVLALSVNSNRLFDSISAFYENAYELAGAKNIVNAILGDFRAFDTMLEVVVLLIAGLGVYVLIKLKASKGGRDLEGK
ncbi:MULTISPECIES: Na+/H+ antiporter subunit A [Shouchella]|uniref:Multiple resistance and pH regulation related protein MrpA n=3 Tax=Shouchella TaxID=2893057 RepID=Q5WJX9_SHOC1|nr:Na+/H+ antiporter subunit A [Shouchella clausii]MCM3314166.1 Na+/H+ antiporter subunit A [Psychrobacillus sp. MER TA 17]MBU3230506.1 Na+/H+ antiporter subunit A [Shouchella clausii]MBU3262295.1 Na+/H+ antiporter subunit A [Shouchella clausii]MBU3533555.1 Na+/H+ antiporter subunit A [Shouchella clausii]MBX0306225.1 Na+/H+ antiporter subunit A [Shouchella clausii]